jgi:hypothetical protein
MTNLEALRMVRSASLHAQPLTTKIRATAKASREIENTFYHAENALEFEVAFERDTTEQRKQLSSAIFG